MPLRIQLKEENDNLTLLIGDNCLTLQQADILSLKADALVCPVDPLLDTQTGVAKIVMKAAGPSVRAHKPVFPEPHGKVVVLPAGYLKAKYLFLTVLLGEKNEMRRQLFVRQAVERAILYAEFLHLKSMAFPVLGSPQEAQPYEIIAHEMLGKVAEYFQRRRTKIKTIFFSSFNKTAFDTFCHEARNLAHL